MFKDNPKLMFGIRYAVMLEANFGPMFYVNYESIHAYFRINY